MRRSFTAVAGGIALIACLSLSPIASARRRPSMVSCNAGECITHFKVDLQGTQDTTWFWPDHFSGGDCYSREYNRADGQQTIAFSGTGTAQLITVGNKVMSFTFYVRKHAPEPGIAAGKLTTTQQGEQILRVDPGPCGAKSNLTGGNVMTGCGTETGPVGFMLEWADPRHVRLSTDDAILPLNGSNGPQLSGECAPMATGIPGWNNPDLYDGFTEVLPLSDLISPRYGKIILLANKTFETQDPPPFPGNVPVTASTELKWTLSLTRIRHAPFAVAG